MPLFLWDRHESNEVLLFSEFPLSLGFLHMPPERIGLPWLSFSLASVP